MSENIKKRYKGYMHYQRYNSTLAPSLLVAVTRAQGSTLMLFRLKLRIPRKTISSLKTVSHIYKYDMYW